MDHHGIATALDGNVIVADFKTMGHGTPRMRMQFSWQRHSRTPWLHGMRELCQYHSIFLPIHTGSDTSGQKGTRKYTSDVLKL